MVEEAEKRKKTKPKKLGLVIGGDRPEEGTRFCIMLVQNKALQLIRQPLCGACACALLCGVACMRV